MKHPGHRRLVSLGLSALGLVFLGDGCGHGGPSGAGPSGATSAATEGRAASAPVPAQKAPARDRDDGMQVKGTLGELDQEQVEQKFKEHLDEITRCYKDVTARLWYLSGGVEVRLRIGEDGNVRRAEVSRSSLGNYDVERCVLAVAQRLSFSPPRGGEAEFTYPVEFPVQAQVRSWPEDRVAAEVRRHRKEIFGCEAAGKATGKRALLLTLYIGPGGRVTSAGLSGDGPIDERVGLCLVGRAQGWHFDDPMGQMAKASYAIN